MEIPVNVQLCCNQNPIKRHYSIVLILDFDIQSMVSYSYQACEHFFNSTLFSNFTVCYLATDAVGLISVYWNKLEHIETWNRNNNNKRQKPFVTLSFRSCSTPEEAENSEELSTPSYQKTHKKLISHVSQPHKNDPYVWKHVTGLYFLLTCLSVD